MYYIFSGGSSDISNSSSSRMRILIVCMCSARMPSMSSRFVRALCMTSTCVCSVKNQSSFRQHWPVLLCSRWTTSQTVYQVRWCSRLSSSALQWSMSCRRMVSLLPFITLSILITYLLFRSTRKSRPNNFYMGLRCPSVHPSVRKKFFRFR